MTNVQLLTMTLTLLLRVVTKISEQGRATINLNLATALQNLSNLSEISITN